MIVDETFYRRDEAGREPRSMPADTYNIAHLLVAQAARGCVFVPIRGMQYLAVLDADEFIFVDREGGRLIEIAWQHFRPQARAALDEPVPYDAVFYSPEAPALMARLQGEFRKALLDLRDRQPSGPGARVIKLPAARG